MIKEKISESFSLYNIDRSVFFSVKYQRKVEINGKCYKTVAETGKDKTLGAPESTIKRRITSLKFPNYKEIKRFFGGYSIDGKFYAKFDDIVKAGLANDRQVVLRRIKSPKLKWKDWKKLSE